MNANGPAWKSYPANWKKSRFSKRYLVQILIRFKQSPSTCNESYQQRAARQNSRNRCRKSTFQTLRDGLKYFDGEHFQLTQSESNHTRSASENKARDERATWLFIYRRSYEIFRAYYTVDNIPEPGKMCCTCDITRINYVSTQEKAILEEIS